MDTARDDNASEKLRGDSAAPPSVPALAEFRNRARQLMRSQSERVQRVESTLANQLNDLLQELQQGHGGPERESDHQQTIEDLKQQIETLQQARGELEETLSEARSALSNATAEQQDLSAQIADHQAKLDAQSDEMRLLREQADNGPGEDSEEASRIQEQLAELRAERDDLQARLQTAESGLEQAGSGETEEVEDLRRRFEMAVQEVRELKAQNAELTDQLNTQQSSSAAAPPPAGGFDWEEQKQRLMAQMDSDFDDGNPQERDDKLTVEGTIRITDEVVAQKEREIAELKTLLENRPDGPSSEEDASPDLDSDERLEKERGALQQMQDEWREKLRQAEVDISVERAKIARERVELEEKLRSIEMERTEMAANRSEENEPDQSKNRPRGRWLTRLGLNEDKE